MMGGGGGGDGDVHPPPRCLVYTPKSVVLQLPPTHPGTDRRGRTKFIAALQLPHVYLPFPFSGNPVSSQYPDTLLSYWLGLSLAFLFYPSLRGGG
jgi:hypothetical protein